MFLLRFRLSFLLSHVAQLVRVIKCYCLLCLLPYRYSLWRSLQAPSLNRQAATRTADHQAVARAMALRHSHHSEAQATDRREEDSRRSVDREAVDTHREDTEAAVEAEDIRQEAMEAAAEVAEDTNKSRSVTQATKELTLIRNCCTKSRKFCSNKRTWAAVVEDMEAAAVTHQADMEAVMEVEFHLNTDHQAKATDHQAALMDLPDMAQAALLQSNSVMLLLVTKSLNT